MITISPTYLFKWKKIFFVGLCVALWSIFLRKILLPDYPCKSHDNDHQSADFIMACKTKENVNIILLDLRLFTFYSVHANESTWHWL